MQALGLHIEGKRLYTVLLTKSKQTLQVAHFQSFHLKDAQSTAKQMLCEKWVLNKKNLLLATGIPSQDVVSRELKFQLTSKATLLSALPFQVENTIPFPPEETLAYCLLHKRVEKEIPLTLFATKHSSLERHLKSWLSLNLDPDTVSCLPNALHRFARYFFPKEPSQFLFYLGETHSTWIILHENRLILSQSLPLGYAHAFYDKDISSLSEATKELALSKTEFCRHLNQSLLRIKQFVETKVTTFSTKEKKAPSFREGFTLPFVFCGPMTALFSPLFTPHFGKPLCSSSKEFLPLLPYAAPFGFALDSLYQDKHSVEFRKEVNPSSKSRKRFNRHLFCYFLISLIFAFLFGSFCSIHLKRKERALEKKLSTILEKEISILDGIATLENSTIAPRATTSLILTVPKVSDVLQWIGTHPLLKKRRGSGSVDVTRLQYHLERYPKLSEKKEPYVAAVELEITSSSPTIARDFYHALLKGDSLVDEKKEVVWKTSHNSYYTKFYLKKKSL